MKHIHLRIVEDADEFDTGDHELIVLPLSGSCRVTIDGERFELQGRESVFTAVTDFAYAPIGARVEIFGEGRFAMPSAKAAPGYDLYYLNVMAGVVREWNFVDDPDHAWIRASWAGQELDPRLPMTR